MKSFECAGLLVIAACLIAAPQSEAAVPVDFATEIQPIFVQHCYRCHGPDKQRSGFRLDQRAAALAGGDLGEAIIAGRSTDSPLLTYIAGGEPEMRMPPEGPRLSTAEIGRIKLWIDQGAKWPEATAKTPTETWWSLRPLARPPLPKVAAADRAWVRTPVDAFIIAQLHRKQLKPAPEADRRTLIRRLTYDLTGLPPEPAAIDAFVRDPAPDAYEQLVDQLLASPRYGERWARHWLDVVHYADTHGYDKDQPRPHAWPYRDYVVRAFNDDKPYARFVQEQLAGDVLFPGARDGIEALGFIAAGSWDLIGHKEVPETKVDGKIARLLDRDDMVASTFNTFNSLTVQCARCHNHKFDPISQEAYYSLQAVFAAIDRAEKTYDADPAIGRRRGELAARRDALQKQSDGWQSIARTKAGKMLTELEDQLKTAAKREREALERQRDRLLDESLNSDARDEWKSIRKELSECQRKLAALPKPGVVFAGTVHFGKDNFRGTGPDGGKPREIHVLRRGDVRQPGQIVQPAALPIIPGDSGKFSLSAGAAEGERRAALARWITRADHPLTWRSIVNRVWLYHLGRGLVDSPNDFGRMGRLPSHPELLDWLAVEFRDGGQSLKRLHRLLVTSAVYRQASQGDSAQAARDAQNENLWRMNRRKLEAEAIRDTVLAVAGKLNLAAGGPGFQDFVVEQPQHSPHYQYHLADPDDARTQRRSIYRFIVRSQGEPLMSALDCADPSMSVDKRNESSSPLQALALLNDRFMVTMAGHFAERVEHQATGLPEQIDLAFRLALGRHATDAECEQLATYGSRHGLANTCRLILNLSEFTFID